MGYFIEIEVKNYDTSIMEEYDKLLELAKQLNLNLDNIDKRGYPYHFIYDSKSLNWVTIRSLSKYDWK